MKKPGTMPRSQRDMARPSDDLCSFNQSVPGTERIHFQPNSLYSMRFPTLDTASPAVSPASYNLGPGPYAIQKYSNERNDDPFVATGAFSTPSRNAAAQQRSFGIKTPMHDVQMTEALQDSFAQPADVISMHHGDSGYGGSHPSLSVTSPSVSTKQSRQGEPHACPRCGAAAKNKSELKKHINRHDKPHKCEHGNCRKGFATQNDLDRHKRTVHRHELPGQCNAVSYTCSYCVEGSGRPRGRRKIEWTRKDNFLAHLERVHGKHHLTSDNLDQFISRATTSNTPTNIRQDTLQDDLQGVGNFAILVSPRPGANYALPPPGDLTDPLAQQRFEQAMNRCYESTNVLEACSGQRFISPQILAHETNREATQSSLPSLQGPYLSTGYESGPGFMSTLSSSRTHAMPHVLDEVSCHSYALSSSLGNDINMAIGESEFYDMHRSEEQMPTDEPAVAAFEPEDSSCGMIPTHGQQANTFRPETAQTPARAPSSTNLMDFLQQVPRKTLQAALEKKSWERDDGSTDGTDGASRSPKRCPMCSKSFNRPCEVKKHMKRHSKPYGCTWSGCEKFFGSKNDWKRHEVKQHFNIDAWSCDVGGCGMEFNRRETFRSHLRQLHQLTDRELDAKVDHCRAGQPRQHDFWCGFCVKYIELDGNFDPWIKRFDHIDDHFCGRDGLRQQNIGEWTHEPQKVEEFEEALDAGSLACDQITSVPSLWSEGKEAKKRLADLTTMDSPLKKRQCQKLVTMWICCQCSDVNNWQFSECCTNCHRRRCGECQMGSDVEFEEAETQAIGNRPADG